MRQTRRQGTHLEMILRSALHRLGLRFRVQRRIISQSRASVDIAFISAKVAVLVDSCFWHGCPVHGTMPKANAEWWQTKLKANRSRDHRTRQRMVALGWHVVRIWEHDDFEKAAKRIRKIVMRRQHLLVQRGQMKPKPLHKNRFG